MSICWTRNENVTIPSTKVCNVFPESILVVNSLVDGFKLPKKAKISSVDTLLEEKMKLLLDSSPNISPEITNNVNTAECINVTPIEINNKHPESPTKLAATESKSLNKNSSEDNYNDDDDGKHEQRHIKPELVKTNSKVSLESVLEYWAVDVSEVQKEGMLLGQGHFANVYKGTFRVRPLFFC